MESFVPTVVLGQLDSPEKNRKYKLYKVEGLKFSEIRETKKTN